MARVLLQGKWAFDRKAIPPVSMVQLLTEMDTPFTLEQDLIIRKTFRKRLNGEKSEALGSIMKELNALSAVLVKEVHDWSQDNGAAKLANYSDLADEFFHATLNTYV